MFEKVNPSHPDKMADRIAGALVDLAYQKSPNPKIAVEVLIGHGICHIINETSEHFELDEIQKIVYRIIKDFITIDYAEYLQDHFLSNNQKNGLRCGDNGIFKGVPITDEQTNLSGIAKQLYQKYPYDGKYIIDSKEKRIIICQSNASASDIKHLPFLEYIPYTLHINPLGNWSGGINVDSGATNRKLGSDMGNSITGGGLHGKDLSKPDIALNVYAWHQAQKRNKKIEISCAIGDQKVIIRHKNTAEEKSYSSLVQEASEIIKTNYGSFEKLAEWGLF